MEILRDPTPSADLPRGCVVTIGNFDGVHRGHEMLLRGAVARARELEAPAVALTFEPHPEKVLRPGSGLKLLSTRAQKAQLLQRLGIETLVEVGFDRRFAATTAEAFARDFLFGRLAPREVRIGANFRFGAGRQGDVEFLERMGRLLGFEVVGFEPVMDNGGPISSSRIRREVGEGHMEEAWRLLDRPYYVDGTVYSGERMGRTFGFPTINVELENELCPPHGVYVTAAHLPSFNRVFRAVTNIGVRPTVYENYRVTVESHLLDFTADVYRERVRVYFMRRLRDEMVFPSSMDLVAQIRKDADASRQYFEARGMPEGELVLR